MKNKEPISAAQLLDPEFNKKALEEARRKSGIIFGREYRKKDENKKNNIVLQDF